MPPDLNWQRLSALGHQLQANLAALLTRTPSLAQRLQSFAPKNEYVLAVRGDSLIIGKLQGTTVDVRPCVLSALAAHQTLQKVYPTGACTEPLLVAGVDQGWLWQQVYEMPCATPSTPGHRPPLYFLVKDLEELWAALHLHDWRKMLADPRVRLLAGEDVVEQLRQSLLEHWQTPEPRLALTLGASIWPDGNTLESVLAGARATLGQRFKGLMEQYPRIYDWAAPESIAHKLGSGEKLRVLGITSRFTTFLQYSMRDWLAAFDRLGHNTRMLIEGADHEILNSLSFAQICFDYRPDLILMIDHYRGEHRMLPEQVPCVMWVQDMLPNIFAAKGGAAQGPMDFCLGFGRLHLCSKYGYPADRYMPTTMGVNEERFDRSPLTPAQIQRHGCEVSYVSHASTPASVLLQAHLDRQTEHGKRFLKDVYERMAAHYHDGGHALSDVGIRLFIDDSMRSMGVAIPEEELPPLRTFLNNQISNALFRHQTLIWLSEMGLDLHIYGRGWDTHPQLSRHARGIADNITDLGTIYRASKINIQVTPHGAVHQRLLDGLAAGGFFLLRAHPGDRVGPIYQELWRWCERNGIGSNEHLYARADERIQEMIAQINRLESSPDDRREMTVFDVMNAHRDNNFMGCAASIWSEYEQVAFDNRQELEQKVRHFLSNDEERTRIASSMRETMIERTSYVSISRRLLDFIANRLGRVEALAA